MHSIKRTTEPIGLKDTRVKYTGQWVRFYRYNSGPKPTDHRWLNFADDLRDAFHYLCAYCEELCKGEVEHFRPKSLYPWLVYHWSNWLLACRNCNGKKLDRWHPVGYVDPCLNVLQGLPQFYFRWDTKDLEIQPKEDLGSESCRKAQRTIDDIGLNDRHHIKKREEWLIVISTFFSERPSATDPRVQAALAYFTSRTTRQSSFARAWLAEQGYPTV